MMIPANSFCRGPSVKIECDELIAELVDTICLENDSIELLGSTVIWLAVTVKLLSEFLSMNAVTTRCFSSFIFLCTFL